MNTQKSRRAGTTRSLLAIGTIAVLALSACAAGGDSGDDADEIVIGMALSQSGNMAPFDVEPGNAALLKIDEINAAGGINGMQVRAIVKDVRSDQATVGTVATELISAGIDLLVTPCDFDLSAQGALNAQAAEVPAVSICAGDPKMADTTTLGDFVFSANAGSDVEGSTGASWAYEQGWASAYLLQDESIEYTKSAGRYFQAKLEELGGAVVGNDSFPGGDNVDVSSQISRLKSDIGNVDFIYVASWNPGAATAIRQIRDAGIDTPIVGPAALDGQLLLDIVGDVEDVYYTPFACYEYCSGQDSADLDAFVTNYTAKFDAPPSTSYALLGYNMMTALAASLESADSLDGPVLRDAMENSSAVETPIGPVTYFSATCHKITDMPLSVVKVSGGSVTFVEQHSIDGIPDLGDGNSCAA
ncbi:putative branched chain amino acid binding periplasmic abc transporter protein [marine actinobacterium PHSC20C1]|nr:putative branched chain amino acid binding periplasmic abc transporter protein [marine actinobacterium PHSC20C1]